MTPGFPGDSLGVGIGPRQSLPYMCLFFVLGVKCCRKTKLLSLWQLIQWTK